MTSTPRTCTALLALVSAGAFALPVVAEEIKFMAELSGAAQVPPVETEATGMADVTVDTEAMTISWMVTYEGLSGDPVAGHFHGPAAPDRPQNAPPVIDLSVDMEGAEATATAEGTTETTETATATAEEEVPQDIMEGASELTDEQMADLEAGLLYINIHTEQHPDGEIRGQVVEGESEISERRLGLDATPAAAAGGTETEGAGAVEQEDPAADADAVAPDEAAAGVVDPAGDAGAGLEPSDDAGAEAVEQEDPAADADAVAPDEAAAGVLEPAGNAAAGLEPGDEAGDCTDVVEQEDPAADADAVAPDEAAAGVLEPAGDASAGLEPGNEACAEVVERDDPAADADEVSPDEAAAGVLESSGEAGGGLEPGDEASTEPAATE